uniref:TIP41-like protein n=1 Tax=Chlamydomonas leiostraca TaxID=1034604 RepID=A0A7S0RYW5_9CHLO|mmetsp:Transcript_34591/g.87493  ORF Transcript_34591/g.87493 Transcript_34591/m.87493 type:complete len:329 (+) Transcript_34591:110-1096(+)|eukprot:CAMPEP_0202869696 /NCGR_PEP_ID=MMETSP1391-20130828/12593_1 /ASSEMBLY_ACC=CAM_ASM_000867 /TAXON_ID=1034604 /ORGANISM="Chlamydomonas leiostraca, Strain SAG 11-49" /LENGTH=328 /DNA_ID=CAMNT_0049550039 /DNA_START=88 /DNA_END=1074 /DNA_ORIENTATION=+
MASDGAHAHKRLHSVKTQTITSNGWKITTRKGPIISDHHVDEFRQAVGCGEGVRALPEMLFSSSRVTLEHEASGLALDFTAADALKGWVSEALPPLQVKVAQEWQRARRHEIEAQKAVQLEYDWTFTTPYTGTVVPTQRAHEPTGPGDVGHYSSSSSSTASGSGGAGDAQAPVQAQVQLPEWEETSEQIDRALLMERDPILFFDEVVLYESDLDDNGVAQMSAKLRVMPRAWLLLLRFWLRVDGCMVRVREARLFCRTDSAEARSRIIREVKWCEGEFGTLRAAGAPGDGPAYADGDAASGVFQAVAPTGLKHFALSKLTMPTKTSHA